MIDGAWRTFPHTFAAHASGWTWRPEPHLRYISKRITAALAKGGARLKINCPPRHGKSFLTSYWLPVWFLENWPEKRVIVGAYGAEIAVEWGRRVRNEFATNTLLRTKLRDDSTAANRWATEHGGGMMSVGVGGPISGFGGDLLIADDLIKNWQYAHSRQNKLMLRDWWRSTFFTRKEPSASVIVAMTRWAEDDVCAWLDSEFPGEWETIRLPALAEPNDPLGRAEGAALCPSRYNAAALEQERVGVGAAVWSALYQQAPEAFSTGRLYKAFNAGNVSSDLKLNHNLPLALAVDFNISPGMHGILMQHDPTADRINAIMEFHGPRMDVRQMLDSFAGWLRVHDPGWSPGVKWRFPDFHIFGDASGNAKWAATSESCYDVLRQKMNTLGIPYRVRVPASNPPVRERVDTLNEALCDVEGVRHIYVHPNCVRLIEDCKAMKPDEHGLIDKHEHNLSHASDALGYAVVYLRPLWRHGNKDRVGGRMG
jgi:hypothetical protein